MTNGATEWRPIPGFDRAYEVSNHGHVRSLDRTVHNPSKGPTRISGRDLKPMETVKGYLTVALYRDGVRAIRPIHRLVLEAFVGGAPDLASQACHADGDPKNNYLSNLRWADNSENQRDSVAHGTHRSARVEACPSGHPYSIENTYVNPRGERQCRKCQSARSMDYQARQRAKAGAA